MGNSRASDALNTFFCYTEAKMIETDTTNS